jgi:hypothetical protein
MRGKEQRGKIAGAPLCLVVTPPPPPPSFAKREEGSGRWRLFFVPQ